MGDSTTGTAEVAQALAHEETLRAQAAETDLLRARARVDALSAAHETVMNLLRRVGTRLQYDLCSHVYSHYPSTAKGSLLPPLWLKYHCRSPEKTIANAEAVHLLLSLWLRTDHSCINKEHIHIGENLRFTGYQP